MTLSNFIIGVPFMLMCVVVQAATAFWCVRYFMRNSEGDTDTHGFLASLRPLLVAMLVMMLGSLVEISLWGLLFMMLGEFNDLGQSIYHSAVNFTSLGYGDVVMSEKRRLLGPLEALNGVLMLGMSGAALMAILQELINIQRRAKESE
jgi:hypothetical protein